MIHNPNTPIEFRYLRGKLRSINRVPAAAMPIVTKYEPFFNDHPVRHDDGTCSEYSDLKGSQVKALRDELTNAGFSSSKKVIA